jgi:ketosteroid isomerase-like protein
MSNTTDSSLSTVQSAYEAFGRGDVPSVLSLLHADVEWTFPDALGLWFEGTHRGPNLVAERVFGGIGSNMLEFRIEPERFVAVGNHVAVTGSVKAVTRAGGRIEASYFQVWRVEGGKATRVTEYHERDTWLRALAGH